MQLYNYHKNNVMDISAYNPKAVIHNGADEDVWGNRGPFSSVAIPRMALSSTFSQLSMEARRQWLKQERRFTARSDLKLCKNGKKKNGEPNHTVCCCDDLQTPTFQCAQEGTADPATPYLHHHLLGGKHL